MNYYNEKNFVEARYNARMTALRDNCTCYVHWSDYTGNWEYGVADGNAEHYGADHVLISTPRAVKHAIAQLKQAYERYNAPYFRKRSIKQDLLERVEERQKLTKLEEFTRLTLNAYGYRLALAGSTPEVAAIPFKNQPRG